MAVAFVDVFTDTDVTGSLSCGSITANSNYLYVACMSSADTNDGLGSISGCGLTWNHLTTFSPIDPNGGGTHSKMWIWVGSGTPTTGSVSMSLDNSDQCCGMVARFSGVDLSSLITSAIDNSEGISGTGAAYDDSIVGSTDGMMMYFSASGRRALTGVDQGTIQAQVNTGASVGDASLALVTLALTADGAQAYGGDYSGSNTYCIANLTLLPEAGSTTHSGAAAVTGSATVAGAVTLDAKGAGSLTGSASVSPTAQLLATASGALTGSATVAGLGVRVQPLAASVTATGEATANAFVTFAASGSLFGTATIAGIVGLDAAAAGSLLGSATATAIAALNGESLNDPALYAFLVQGLQEGIFEGMNIQYD